MRQIGRQELREIYDEVADWVVTAQALLDHRKHVEDDAENAVLRLTSALHDVIWEAEPKWRVLPITVDVRSSISAIARSTALQLLEPHEEAALDRLLIEGKPALNDARDLVSLRRLFTFGSSRRRCQAAMELVEQLHEWGVKTGIPELLVRLDERSIGSPRIAPVDMLSDWVGLGRHLVNVIGMPALIENPQLTRLSSYIETIDKALQDEDSFREQAIKAGEDVRSSEVKRLASEMPVERLREVTRDSLRIGPLTHAGINTVQDVIEHASLLEHLPGLGRLTAKRLRGAATTIIRTLQDETPVRIELSNPTIETTALLRSLQIWDTVRTIRSSTTDLDAAEALRPLAESLDFYTTHLIVFDMDPHATGLHDLIDYVRNRSSKITKAMKLAEEIAPWDDFLTRPSDYYAMLSELSFAAEDEKSVEGGLGVEIVAAVRALDLETEHLTAALRGYQSFAARFALTQRKVIIGDEMGLGKTIEALAVLAHLRAKGLRYSVVICPASLVTNWLREIQSKSTLRAYRLHGPNGFQAARNWTRDGGVAVTTFEWSPYLHLYRQELPDLQPISCVVVDEAHYIKNPDAARSITASRLVRGAEYAVLLTGTPLENNVKEFRNLVEHVRPDLVPTANDFAPSQFRKQVAPVYLRRNQEDVLMELPELIETDEWLPMSKYDEECYLKAVRAGDFMAMRQAATHCGRRSEKVQRLVEIVEEARANGRRVIVFSYFRNTLEQVVTELTGQVFGPLNGSVPAARRQKIIDDFAKAPQGAVLVSQITSGGVGLNIQAASVVIICEPQLKPTTEWQAIARAHRMGQLHTVQVHRLLSREGVDSRITARLAMKKRTFDEFARVSETAESAAEAIDISDIELARVIVAEERERLFGLREVSRRSEAEE